MSFDRRLVLLVLVGFVIASVPGFSQEPEAEGDGVRTVYLIRHGEYDHDDERDPDVGRALVPLGVAQAKLLAARLRAMPVEFDSLHSSTMTRARQTALVLGEEFPDLKIQTSRLIRECTPPTWREDIMADETEEDLAACEKNLDEAFPIYLAPSPDRDRHDLVVCHGNVIRYWVTKALKVDTMAWLGMSIENCSLTVIKIKPDGSMKVLSYSDGGHIPPNLTTRTTPGHPIDLSIPNEVVAEDSNQP